jgi:tetratricopeptide (TPR) repeat protein
MRAAKSALVHILRDFLSAYLLMQDLFARQREGVLRFEDLRELVGDDERSVLFRLKERCHAAFRTSRDASGLALQREALFDLAVGSLFHEAMKLREDFYQQEVYGPRVRALRSRAGRDASELFEEFDRLLEGVSKRLEEGLRESEALLAQTVDQLRLLLGVHRGDGAVARFLIENAASAEEAFGTPLDALLSEIHGSTAAAYQLAGTSYLDSGYYALARAALEEAAKRDGDHGEIAPLLDYARGMDAYLKRDYEGSLAALASWAASRDAVFPARVRLARDAVACIVRLAEGDERARILADASALLTRIGASSAAP